MKLYLILILLTASYQLSAQQCGNCTLRPVIALYDLDVQVPEPGSEGEARKGWLEWVELFWLARHANDYLFHNNKDCIRFMVGPDQDANDDGTQENYKVGATYAHLPHKSYHKGYLTTGYIKQTAEGYLMHMELQSACSRKKIAAADVSFQINNILNDVVILAQQAARQLMPLIEKISQFELNERNANKDFAIGGNARELIEIVPAKKTLTTGQQTDINIKLSDCDGNPLAGREIIFTKPDLPGLNIVGTIGGRVSPSRLITDNEGKAKAIFKMTATAGKPAIINAHSLIRTPENCSDVFIGSAKIDLAYAYKVTVNYQKSAQRKVEMKSKDPIFSITLADEEYRSSVHANTSFYYYGEASERQVSIGEETPSSQIIFTGLRGYSDQSNNVKAPVMSVIPLGSNHKEGFDSVELVFSSDLLRPQISFTFEGDDLKDFDFDFNFRGDRSGKTPDSGGILIINGDKDASFEKRKIIGSTTLFKTEHIIRYSRKTNISNEYGQGTEVEFAEIVILSFF